jgi:hypothetical protein
MTASLIDVLFRSTEINPTIVVGFFLVCNLFFSEVVLSLRAHKIPKRKCENNLKVIKKVSCSLAWEVIE